MRCSARAHSPAAMASAMAPVAMADATRVAAGSGIAVAAWAGQGSSARPGRRPAAASAGAVFPIPTGGVVCPRKGPILAAPESAADAANHFGINMIRGRAGMRLGTVVKKV